MKEHGQMLDMTKFHCPKTKPLRLASFSIKQNVSHISSQSHHGCGQEKSQKNFQKDAKRAAIELGKPKSPSMTSRSS